MNEDLEQIKQEIAKVKAKQENNLPAEQSKPELTVSDVINENVQGMFVEAVKENGAGIKELTQNAVKTELEIKNEQISGRKDVEKSKVRKDVAKAKTEEDEAQHERSETILKSQGLTSRLPSIYRITALIIGYPFFVLYLLTVGWVIQILTFVVKGFITMVADCAERFAEVNKKFVDNNNEKKFNLGRAMINILKWVLIIGSIVAVVVLLILK